jgi:hypothetical protein
MIIFSISKILISFYTDSKMMDLWWQLRAVFGTVLSVHEEINGLGEWTMLDNIDCQVDKTLIKQNMTSGEPQFTLLCYQNYYFSKYISCFLKMRVFSLNWERSE